MRPDILIVGQGLAGTLLAWELERAGIAFAIADQGHVSAATSAAAGILNPITGRRLVKSWQYERLFPLARESYQELAAAVGIGLWKNMRVRRSFVDDREIAVGANPQKRVELAAYIETADASGWWIRDAARVDLRRLLEATRARWAKAGWLRTEPVEVSLELGRFDLVVDCRGQSGTVGRAFDFVPWEYSKGELLELALEGLERDVILNRRFWIVPNGAGAALAGATHEPGVRDPLPSEAGRAVIEAAVRTMLGTDREYSVVQQRAGVRVTLPDKRPVAGRHPTAPRLGVVNGLGAKGALWAPMLARQWVNHLTEGVPFDSEIDVRRFAG